MYRLLPLLIISLWQVAAAEPLQVQITPGDSRHEVRFVSEAATETVSGKTRMAQGSITFDPASDSAWQAEIRVDLATIKTGIDLRDRHMRENHLETKQYPEAVFTLTSISLPTGSLREGERSPVRVTGRFQLHGIEREITPTTYLTYTAAGGKPSLRIESQFTVKLPDYEIKRPQFLVLRLAEEQKVFVDLTAE